MRVVYFVMHYPSATQTFIEREMFALAGQGVQDRGAADLGFPSGRERPDDRPAGLDGRAPRRTLARGGVRCWPEPCANSPAVRPCFSAGCGCCSATYRATVKAGS